MLRNLLFGGFVDDDLLLILLFMTLITDGFRFTKKNRAEKQEDLILFILLATLYLNCGSISHK